MNDLKSGLAVICLAVLLAGCAGAVGNADAGPDPGGGFYDGPNINVGHINPATAPITCRSHLAMKAAQAHLWRAVTCKFSVKDACRTARRFVLVRPMWRGPGLP